MSEKFHLAAAQPFIDCSIKTNSLTICNQIRVAANEGARLIQFPEGALSGYAKSQIREWESFDWCKFEQELNTICITAKERNIWVVVGGVHQSGKQDRPYNSLYVISDQGDVVGRYDKRFCSHTEITNWYSAGTTACIFDVDGFRFGCALCIEIQFPEIFLEYETLDVDCVLFSAYSDDPMFGIQAQGHAACNTYWISLSTPEQCSDKLPNQLIGPNGKIVSHLLSDKIGSLLHRTLDKGDPDFSVSLTKARSWRRIARIGEIYTEYPNKSPCWLRSPSIRIK